MSELEPGDNVLVELPNTDALALLINEFNKQTYISRLGDLEVQLEKGVYRVPAFAEGRARYSEAKARDCARWGCE